MSNQQILLLRHAMATEPTPGQPDHERALTEQGRHRLAQALEGLRNWIDRPDLIAASPLLRAQQTAELTHQAFPDAKRVTCDALTPATPAPRLLAWLDQQADGTIILVGHEPDLSRWAGWTLTGQAISLFQLGKAGACLLERTRDSSPHATLQWLMSAKQLGSQEHHSTP